ncbi:MAG: zinc-ribbon domain-containing protein, partial [Coriobacteriales bacterium]
MRCPVCGSDNRDGALFCRACGSPLDRKAEPVPVNVRAVGQDQPSSKAEEQAASRRADVRQADVS